MSAAPATAEEAPVVAVVGEDEERERLAGQVLELSVGDNDGELPPADAKLEHVVYKKERPVPEASESDIEGDDDDLGPAPTLALPVHRLEDTGTEIHVTVTLPLVTEMAELDITVAPGSLDILAHGLYASLHVDLPRKIDVKVAGARFAKLEHELLVKMKVVELPPFPPRATRHPDDTSSDED